MATITTFPLETTTVTFTGTGAVVKETSPTIATPTLTNPIVGTQSPGDSSTKAASTAFVRTEMAKASFYANKNTTDQTSFPDATYTQVTFGTEVFDIGSFFASNAWTPPAGKVWLSAGAYASGTSAAGSIFVTAIYKNGSVLHLAQLNTGATNVGTANLSIIDVANGSDVYTVYCYYDVSSGTGTISGATTQTFFMGHWISP